MAQQHVHCWSPRTGIADYRVALPVDDGPAATFQENRFFGRGHGPL
jgi:hypothetical protein